MTFVLHPELSFQAVIAELKLSVVLLEDNAEFPWVLLVPRVDGARTMRDLSMEQRLQLMREIALVEDAMTYVFACPHTNVAAIGNVTPQLHVHVVCRREGDPAWPGVVWGRDGDPRDPPDREAFICTVRERIELLAARPDYGQKPE